MKRFALILFCLSAAPLLAASLFAPLKFGKRVLGPIELRPVLGADGKPMLGPAKPDGKPGDPLTQPFQTHKWDGDVRWMAFNRDESGAWNIVAAVCPVVDPTNPDSAGVPPGGCQDGSVQDQVLTAAESQVLTARFKQIVLAKKLKSGD